jgi:hypothetical protein
MKTLRLLLCILLVCGTGQGGSLAAEVVPEYAMKAAYLYNFALFTEWPAPPGASLNLCVLGKESMGDEFEKLEGKLVNGQRMAVSRVNGRDDIAHCQILFLGEAEGINIHHLLKEIDDAPVLTVADNENLMQTGVMIGMSIQNKRLTFDINPHAAKRAHLSISSKLLRLARKVH